jgi:hypothetical protein
LGRFFAEKLRTGLWYALWERLGDRALLDRAVKRYRAAREQWSHLAQAARGVYVSDVTFGIGWFQRGHWADRLEAIDKDIAAMAAQGAKPSTQLTTAASGSIPVAELIAQIEKPAARPVFGVDCQPPKSIRRGQPLSIELKLTDASKTPASAMLWYRQVNQAVAWQTKEMQREGSVCRATIDAAYTDCPYPLQFYFQLRDDAGRATLFPGFNQTLSNMPYFAVRQA